MSNFVRGSKVVLVGLMALSLSAGFGGLASAHSVYNPTITVAPNPAVLGDNATNSGSNSQGFDAVVVGKYLLGGHPYTIVLSSSCQTVVPGFKQIANSNGRVTFVIQGSSCQAGQYPITLDDAMTGQPVASTMLTVLSPRDDDAERQTAATTWDTTTQVNDKVEPPHQFSHQTDEWFAGLLRDVLS